MKLSVVMPYYRNPMMLARQYRVWRDEWRPEWDALIDVVIVDDGSPEPAADVPRPDGLPFVRIFRVMEDRPWHQHGARNLGAYVAEAPALLMTDMDHVIPPATLKWCLEMADKMDTWRRSVFTFARRDAPMGRPWLARDVDEMPRTTRADGSLKPHVNSFLLSKELFWRVGGYDESFCGIYGTDGRFRKRLYRSASQVHIMDKALIRVSRDVIADASTIASRKEGRVPGAKKAVARAKAARGEADKIVTLNFPWERVA
jgi:hypothetical protein